MTVYNNSPYRIDDINFDVSPRSEFELRNGEKISFVDYYKNHHHKNVTDLDQVMLVSMPRERRQNPNQNRAGAERPQTPILLIPEFCVLSGLWV